MENQEIKKDQEQEQEQEQEAPKTLPKDYTVSITLDYPLEMERTVIENNRPRIEKVEVKKLVLKRLQGKHLRALPEGSFLNNGDLHPSAIIPLAAYSADIPVEVADQIDLREIDKVSRALVPFLPKSL